MVNVDIYRRQGCWTSMLLRECLQAAAQHEAYDRKLLLEKTRHLHHMRSHAPNVREMTMGLRVDLIRNIANIAKRCVRNVLGSGCS
jgi:hypothetical protein